MKRTNFGQEFGQEPCLLKVLAYHPTLHWIILYLFYFLFFFYFLQVLGIEQRASRMLAEHFATEL